MVKTILTVKTTSSSLQDDKLSEWLSHEQAFLSSANHRPYSPDFLLRGLYQATLKEQGQEMESLPTGFCFKAPPPTMVNDVSCLIRYWSSIFPY